MKTTCLKQDIKFYDNLQKGKRKIVFISMVSTVLQMMNIILTMTLGQHSSVPLILLGAVQRLKEAGFFTVDPYNDALKILQ